MKLEKISDATGLEDVKKQLLKCLGLVRARILLCR